MTSEDLIGTRNMNDDKQPKSDSAAHAEQTNLAGEKIKSVITRVPGNDAPVGGLKVIPENGWFSASPSGTDSFRGAEHLRHVLEEPQRIVGRQRWGSRHATPGRACT
jgi:phosphoglucomutase